MWAVVVITCLMGHHGRTCTKPIPVYSDLRTFSRADCRTVAADYNHAHLILQKAVCRQVSN